MVIGVLLVVQCMFLLIQFQMQIIFQQDTLDYLQVQQVKDQQILPMVI